MRRPQARRRLELRGTSPSLSLLGAVSPAASPLSSEDARLLLPTPATSRPLASSPRPPFLLGRSSLLTRRIVSK